MTRAKDISKIITDADFSGTLDVAGNLTVDGGTIKLDGNYPTASNNVALGNNALDDGSLSGNANTAIGSSSMTANTSGQKNVGLGESSLLSNTTGSFNTALGQASLEANTTGGYTVAVGTNALQQSTAVSFSVAVGYDALKTNTTANRQVAIGYKALSAFTGTGTPENVAVGFNSMVATTTGAYNTAVGGSALYSNTTGASNTGVGREVLYNNTTGQNNSASGFQALSSNTTASHNTAFGSRALNSNTTGEANVAVGREAGYSNTINSNNTFIGRSAGSATTGGNNTFIGRSAGSAVSSGSRNTIIGRFNGNQGNLDIRTSSNNIVLSDGDGNPNLLIDNAGRIRHFSTSNTNGSVNLVGEGVSSYKAISFTRTTNGSEVGSIVTNVSSTSYNTSSDYRLKENVVDMTGAIDRVKQLSPKRFNFIADADTTVDGFLAHEAQTVIPEAVSGVKDAIDEDGNIDAQGIDQSKIVPLLTGALKEAIAKIEDLEARIATLEGA